MFKKYDFYYLEETKHKPSKNINYLRYSEVNKEKQNLK